MRLGRGSTVEWRIRKRHTGKVSEKERGFTHHICQTRRGFGKGVLPTLNKDYSNVQHNASERTAGIGAV